MGQKVSNPPHWVWLYKQRYKRLWKILESLERMTGSSITDEKLEQLGIEMNNLDFFSGATESSITTYFMPRADDLLSISKKRGVEPCNPFHDQFVRATEDQKRNMKPEIPPHIPPQRLLEVEFRRHTRSLSYDYCLDCYCLGEWIMRCSPPKDESYESEGGQQHFYTTAYGRMPRSRQSHRQVVMVSDECTDPNRLTVAELMVLVTCMLGGMKTQEKIFSRRTPRRENSNYHHIFPAQIISFQAPSRARILCGYFGDRLRIQFTDAKDFGVDNYAEMMDTLLQWAASTTHGDTTKVVPLPTIPEIAGSESEKTCEELDGEVNDETSERASWNDWYRLICVY